MLAQTPTFLQWCSILIKRSATVYISSWGITENLHYETQMISFMYSMCKSMKMFFILKLFVLLKLTHSRVLKFLVCDVIYIHLCYFAFTLFSCGSTEYWIDGAAPFTYFYIIIHRSTVSNIISKILALFSSFFDTK